MITPNEELEDDALIRAFERCNLVALHHRDHVQIAWIYLSRMPTWQALSRICDGLRALCRSHGRPGKYHETITWAFTLLIRERMEGMGGKHSWLEFAAANADVLDWPNGILRRYYGQGTLSSSLARRVFVLPDARIDHATPQDIR